MALNKKEKEKLKMQIQQENILVRRLGKWVKISFLLCIAFAAVAFWGFSGMKDALLPNIPEIVRNIVKWLALVFAILSGVFGVLASMSFRNWKKHLLKQIDLLK